MTQRSDREATAVEIEFAFEVFIAATTLWGQRWEAKHGTTPTPEWTRMLSRYVGKNPKALVARIAGKLKPNERGETWPPEMVDALNLLKPTHEELGIPSCDQAYRAATHSRWTLHPVVYETARRVGVYELQTRGEARSKPEFEREYARVCDELMRGDTSGWQKPSDNKLLADNRRPKHVGKYPEVPKFDFAALKRSLGPMPAPIPKDEPPAPINDEQFAAMQAAEQEAINEVAARYEGRA